METTNTLEIELWSVRLLDNVVRLVYTIYRGESESNVTQGINLSTLIKHVKETGMNLQYVYAVDELTELDAETFTTENLHVIAKDYILANLK